MRYVDVFQDLPSGEAGKVTEPMFVAIVGFKRDEGHYHEAGHKKRRRDFGHQSLPRDYLDTEYGDVLGKRRFDEMMVCQGMDALWPEGLMSLDGWKKRGDVFPGLTMKKLDLSKRNDVASEGALEDGGKIARDWRCLLAYKYIDGGEETIDTTTKGKQPGKKKKSAADDELNLFACAHIYASDRNSLFTVQRAIGLEKYTGHIGSLSHTVNFPGDIETLRMIGENGQSKEFVQESWAGASGDDRVCHESRIWDRATGTIIATTVQDGMMRMPVTQRFTVPDGEIILRREAKL